MEWKFVLLTTLSRFVSLPLHFTQVEVDMAKTLLAWLKTTIVGISVDYIIAYLKAVAETPEKASWARCIAEYNKNRTRPFQWGREWVRDHMHKWGFSFRVGTTVARKVPPNITDLHELFKMRLAHEVRRDLPFGITMLVDGERVPVTMIPPDLVINSDQGAIPWVAFRNATWAPTGAKAVPLTGQDDKRNMTAVLGSNARGKLVPLQVVMQGENER